MATVSSILTVVLTHINQFIILGFLYTCGIYQIVFLKTFQQGVTLTSWVMSVQLGMLCLAGIYAASFT